MKGHFNTIAAVCDRYHACGRQCLLNPEYLVVLSVVQFLKVAYNGKLYILDLWLIILLLSLSSIWMCHLDSIVSLGVELDNQV